MIVSFLNMNPECRILHRQDLISGTDDYAYALSEPIKYLLNNVVNKYKRNLPARFSETIAIFITNEVIHDYDKILIDNYEYEIFEGGVLLNSNTIISDKYYTAYIKKRREYNENKITISTRIR